MNPLKPDQDYLQFLQQGHFRIQRDKSTGRHFFYPRVAAPGNGSTDLEWVDASGLGQVYATTVVRVKPPGQDYNVCVVELEEGPRMLSRVEQLPPGEVRIGMRVKARIARDGETSFVVFDPLEQRA